MPSLVLAFFCAGLFLGVAWERNPALLSSAREVREGGYKLVNPLLECESAETSFTELRPFKEKLTDYAADITKNTAGIDFIAIYFRDLNNGPWFGINEKEPFSPASLLKVPLAITYFKEAEAHPDIFEKMYTFENDGMLPATEQITKPKESLEIGKKYRTDDLIRRMLVYSDNYAQHLLVKNIDVDTLKRVYDEFGLNLPNAENPETLVSVKTYAGFFRILFNSSYLNKNSSEKMLEFLAESQFESGLVAGVPDEITVAHKFGERQKAGNDMKQLHDCGIVYYPAHPYLLCVMTRGNDYNKLSESIRNLSRVVYEEIDNQYGRH